MTKPICKMSKEEAAEYYKSRKEKRRLYSKKYYERNGWKRMIKKTSPDIESLESQIKELQEKVKALRKEKNANLVDYKRLKEIDKNRHVALASHISYIARAAITGYQTEYLQSWQNIPSCRHELAQQVASQIIDIYEQAYNQHIWEKDVNNNE